MTYVPAFGCCSHHLGVDPDSVFDTAIEPKQLLLWRAEAELVLGKNEYAQGLALQADETLTDLETFYARRLDEANRGAGNGGEWVKVRACCVDATSCLASPH